LSKPKSYRLSAFLKHSFLLGKIIFLYRAYSYLDRFMKALKSLQSCDVRFVLGFDIDIRFGTI
jgi:hypothetical protein